MGFTPSPQVSSPSPKTCLLGKFRTAQGVSMRANCVRVPCVWVHKSACTLQWTGNFSRVFPGLHPDFQQHQYGTKQVRYWKTGYSLIFTRPVFALTLCLDEMKDLCRDLPGHLNVPQHGLPVHPLQLSQEHHYPGVGGDTGNTRTQTQNLMKVACECVIHSWTNI